MKPCEGCGETKLIRADKKFCSRSCSVSKQHADGRIRQAKGPGHYKWKGSDAKYQALHMRVLRERGRADHCAWRETAGCRSIKYEWAHIHGTDPGDPQNYIPLCKTCHQGYDGQRGAQHASAKLTAEQVSEIQERYQAGGTSQQALADEYGIHQTTISKIVLGKTYLPGEAGESSLSDGRSRSGERHPDAKLTDAQVAEIRSRYVKGRKPTQMDLAREYGVCQPAISAIIAGRSRAT